MTSRRQKLSAGKGVSSDCASAPTVHSTDMRGCSGKNPAVLHTFARHLPPGMERVVDAEIIPRLMLLHREWRPNRPDVTHQKPKPNASTLDSHIEDFARLAITQELDLCCTYVEVLLDRGYTLKDIMMRLMAPAARRLGELWSSDSIDFLDVTIGTSRLQQLVRHFAGPTSPGDALDGRRMLLLPAPDEQHTFGLVVLAESFKSSGWEVQQGLGADSGQVNHMLKNEHWDLIGYSLGSSCLLDGLRKSIDRARKLSRNRSVRIVVGGYAVVGSGISSSDAGADFVASDAAEAVALCG